MRIKAIARNSTLYIVSVMQLLFFPLAANSNSYAQTLPDTSVETTSQQQTEASVEPTATTDSTVESTPTTSNEQTASPATPPVATEEPKLPPGPRGADAGTFSYISSSGLYENDLYVYNPVTQTRTAKMVPDVRYNYQSNIWEKLGWRFSAPLQDYVPYVISTSANRPSGLLIGQAPSPSANSSLSGPNRMPNNNSSGVQSSDTGPNSTINSNTNSNNDIDLDYNNSTNSEITLSLLSQSGNASVLNNTRGGNALTGNADSTANVINMVQSGWNLDGLLSFNANLYGDLYGDL